MVEMGGSGTGNRVQNEVSNVAPSCAVSADIQPALPLQYTVQAEYAPEWTGYSHSTISTVWEACSVG